MSALTARILAEAQHAANEVDHEDHAEAVRVALELAAPLIAAKALRDAADAMRKQAAKEAKAGHTITAWRNPPAWLEYYAEEAKP